jgi:hypothetical protein
MDNADDIEEVLLPSDLLLPQDDRGEETLNGMDQEDAQTGFGTPIATIIPFHARELVEVHVFS